MTAEAADQVRWHLRARWLAALLLALISLVAHLRGYVESIWPLLSISAVVAGYNALLVIGPWMKRARMRATGAGLVLDLVALTAFLHFSGDIENPLILGYVVPITAAAVLLPMRAALAMACGAATLLAGLVYLTLVGVVPHHHLALRSEVSMHGDADQYLAAMRVDYVVSRLLLAAGAALGTAYGFGRLTQRIREKERQLSRENDQLTLLLNTLPVGVVLLRRDGGILLTNPAARRLLGFAEDRPVTALSDGGVTGHLARFRGPVEEFESSERGRHLRHALARGPAEEPIVWVFEDRTKERQLVAQLIHKSKMADLGVLASGIAHEIGNPLSSLSAMLQVMRLKGESGTAQRVQELEAEVERINRIVQDITGFARPSADRACVGVAALVEQASRLFQLHRKSGGIRSEVLYDDGGATVVVVADQIVQVILNLLLNAADASNGAGDIRVRTHSTPGEAAISVTDRGEGMGPETRLRLFTPFFTTKQAGSGVGLGLFVSESIARAHGGRIDVESEPGKGSTFTLWLPRGFEAQA